jgi:hypothetical protein
MALERWTNPKPQRRTRSPRNGVPSCRGKSAGVANGTESALPPEIPNVTISSLDGFGRAAGAMAGVRISYQPAWAAVVPEEQWVDMVKEKTARHHPGSRQP